jgi:hypothetical protein
MMWRVKFELLEVKVPIIFLGTAGFSLFGTHRCSIFDHKAKISQVKLALK